MKNRNPLFWVELTFKGYEDAMIFCVSIFVFCLGPTVTVQLNDKNFRHYYGIFFESTILRLLDHSYVQSSFATIAKHFDNGICNDALQLKILRAWITT